MNDDFGDDRLLAIHDPAQPEMSMGGWTGKQRLTEAGKKWKLANEPAPTVEPAELPDSGSVGE